MKKKWFQIWKRNAGEVPTPQSYFDMAAESGVTEWLNTDTGSTVLIQSANTAMKIAAVYRCVDILSGSIASLPLRFKEKKNGVYQVNEKHEISYLLSVRANSRLTSFDLIKNAVIQMVNHGNAYILPRYSIEGRTDLILLSPHATTYDVNMDQYHVNDMTNNIFDVFDSDEIIHLRNMSLDGGYTGVSTIRYANRVMNVAANADERTLESFKPGSTLKGFISGDGDAGVRGFGEMQDEQLSDVEKRISKEISSGKPIFRIPGAAKFNQLSLSSTDLQLLDTRKFSVLDICRFYGVHPDKVFAGQSQNYKASEMSNQSFLSDTLQPYLRKIESEFTAKLIPRTLAHKMKIEFDVESLLLTSLEQQANYIEKTIQYGVYSPNHWRAQKGQAPMPGGDEIMMSMNVAPINSEKFRGTAKNLPPNSENNDNK
ncbi:phage portal protein [Alistipes sp. OttesenSCG-928-L06]|nr:phage portal protein [Alistipes sp. OttesenSCG-928-L06]